MGAALSSSSRGVVWRERSGAVAAGRSRRWGGVLEGGVGEAETAGCWEEAVEGRHGLRCSMYRVRRGGWVCNGKNRSNGFVPSSPSLPHVMSSEAFGRAGVSAPKVARA